MTESLTIPAERSPVRRRPLEANLDESPAASTAAMTLHLQRELRGLCLKVQALKDVSDALLSDGSAPLDPDALRYALHLQARLEGLLVHTRDAASVAKSLADRRPVRIPA